ncbi:group 10 secretory phospholipase A2 [Thamnophis elegans]|uniref:group 10 secretory phospholipase A2 n=1 Tax=Thamnophis elegans TaxID=35005 RepID=UPI001376CC2C|nr:group 10 secretory phospholipase A2 [Thamnophis elegans]
MAPPLVLPLLLLLLLVQTGHPVAKAPSRPRRGILQLAGMVQCTTGRTPLAYIRYGCYCGWGGHGWPKDQVDWCCFKHDCCYGKAEEENCAPKMRRYPWECRDSKAKCDDIEDKCQKMACECDRSAAKCLAKAPYNVTYLFWPEAQCGERSPACPDD